MTKTRDLADLGGGFIQAGTGAQQRTVESKLQDTVSVKDFGAVGDGVTDDRTAIQNALTYAVSNGKCLYIPSGVYSLEVSSAYALSTGTQTGFSIVGDGYGSTILRIKIGNTGGLLHVANCADFTISGLTFDCNQSVASGLHGLNVTNCQNYTLRSLQIENTGGYGIAAQGSIGAGTSAYITFDDIRLIKSGADGIDFKNPDIANKGIQMSNILVVDPGWLNSQKPGIDVRGPANLTNITVHYVDSTQRQIGVRFRPFVDAGGADSGRYSNISNLLVQDFSGTNLQHQGLIIQTEKVRATNCSFVDCGGGGIYLSPTSPFHGQCSLVNCHAYGGNQGIYIEQPDTTLFGCLVSLKAGATGDAFRCLTYANTKFVCCDAIGGAYGFRSSAGATDITLIECSASGQSTSQFALGATGRAYFTPGWTGNVDLTEGSYVQFGTLDAVTTETVTGFILIKDAGNSFRKLAVIS
jgi:hypothetical protein